MITEAPTAIAQPPVATAGLTIESTAGEAQPASAAQEAGAGQKPPLLAHDEMQQPGYEEPQAKRRRLASRQPAPPTQSEGKNAAEGEDEAEGEGQAEGEDCEAEGEAEDCEAEGEGEDRFEGDDEAGIEAHDNDDQPITHAIAATGP